LAAIAGSPGEHREPELPRDRDRCRGNVDGLLGAELRLHGRLRIAASSGAAASAAPSASSAFFASTSPASASAGVSATGLGLAASATRSSTPASAACLGLAASGAGSSPAAASTRLGLVAAAVVLVAVDFASPLAGAPPAAAAPAARLSGYVTTFSHAGVELRLTGATGSSGIDRRQRLPDLGNALCGLCYGR
jgi:hypothetical protein